MVGAFSNSLSFSGAYFLATLLSRSFFCTGICTETESEPRWWELRFLFDEVFIFFYTLLQLGRFCDKIMLRQFVLGHLQWDLKIPIFNFDHVHMATIPLISLLCRSQHKLITVILSWDRFINWHHALCFSHFSAEAWLLFIKLWRQYFSKRSHIAVRRKWSFAKIDLGNISYPTYIEI